MGRATLLTVARAIGVSRTTVSNAYSRPDKLSAELRARILATARDLGYDGPSALAASLRTGRTQTLGVVLPGDLNSAFTDPTTALFLAGVAEQAQSVNYALTLLPRASSTGRTPLDGLLVYTAGELPTTGSQTRVGRHDGAGRLPTIWVDHPTGTAATTVNLDVRGGAAAAITHLAELRHTRIAAVIVGEGPAHCARVWPDTISRNHLTQERITGWRRAAARAALQPPMLVSCPTGTRQHGRHAARLLMAEEQPPTAVVCASDELARGVLAELAAQGRRVPYEVSVVGASNDMSTVDVPGPTTVLHPLRDQGIVAAGLLIAQVRTGQAATSRMLPTRLITRATTGPRR
jgi:DNA-binding LacI/PurR family transcriptional regulator